MAKARGVGARVIRYRRWCIDGVEWEWECGPFVPFTRGTSWLLFGAVLVSCVCE